MKKIRLFLSLLLFITTILLISTNITGHLLHEILGITICVLVILHLILNRKWIANVTKNITKTKNNIKILYIVDILTFISYLGAILFGILISNQIFDFNTNGNFYLMLLHHVFGRFAIVMMVIHLGFHLKTITNKLTKNETIKGIIYIAYIVITATFTLYLIYTLSNSYVWQSIM